MKFILIVLVLAAAPAVLGAAVQAPDQGNTPQSTSDPRSASDRSTSHDRHMRKHRATSHRHRHRATAKGNTH